MEAIPVVLSQVLTWASSLFTFFFSSWITAIPIVAYVVVFIFDLVVRSSSGDDKQ